MKGLRFFRYFSRLNPTAETQVNVEPLAHRTRASEFSEMQDVSPRLGNAYSGENSDAPDYVPPEPTEDEPVRTYGIGLIVAVVVSAVSGVIIWEAGFGEIFAQSTTWEQISMIVAGGVLAVAFERFARLVELQFESWQRMRQIDRRLRNIEKLRSARPPFW
jgi:hypothetical protein